MIVSVTTLAVLVSAVGAVPSSRLQSRIVNGFPTTIEEHPHQVSIEAVRPSGIYEHICGGSIISIYYVLTAAHCLCLDLRFCSPMTFIQPGYLRLRAGTSYRERYGTEHQVLGYQWHPQYNSLTFDYDVAYIKVIQQFQYSHAVKPIKMTTQTPPAGSAVVVTGWGWLNERQEVPELLQGLHTNIVHRDACRQVYAQSYPLAVTDRHVCTVVPGGLQGACKGDSGGPLVYNGQLVGIVSFGKVPCAVPGYPDVFTDVAYFRTWVFAETGVQ